METINERKNTILRRDFTILLHCLYNEKSLDKFALSYKTTAQEVMENAYYYLDNYATSDEKVKYQTLSSLIDIIEICKINGLSDEEKINAIMKLDFDEKKVQERINAYYVPKIKKLTCGEQSQKNKERINALTIAGVAAGRIIAEKNKQKNHESRKKAGLKNSNKLLAKRVEEAEITVRKYIELATLPSEFFKYSDINKVKLDQSVKTLQKVDSPIYLEYLNTVAEVNFSVKQLLEEIVEELNNPNKNFDIIDYYLTTTIPLKELWKFEKRIHLLDDNKHAIFNIFVSSNKETIMSEDLIMNLGIKRKFEENNRYLSDEEKLAIIELLKENEIPINGTTILSIIQKYSEGKMFLPRVLKK